MLSAAEKVQRRFNDLTDKRLLAHALDKRNSIGILHRNGAPHSGDYGIANSPSKSALRAFRYSDDSTGGRHRITGPEEVCVQRHCSNGLQRRVTHTTPCPGTKPQQRIVGNRFTIPPRLGVKAVGEACMNKPSAAPEVLKSAVA